MVFLPLQPSMVNLYPVLQGNVAEKKHKQKYTIITGTDLILNTIVT